MYSRNKNVSMIPDLLAKLIDEKQMNFLQLEKASGISQHTFKRCVNRENGLQYGTAIKLNQFFETTLFSPYQIKPNGELTYTEQNWRVNHSANKFNIGTVVKNLFNKKLESIVKVRFNKELQEWEYLLAGENQYIEEQFIKSLDKQPAFVPPHKLKPEEPVVIEKPETPKEEVKVEPTPKVEHKIKMASPAFIEQLKMYQEMLNNQTDNKKELKQLILDIVNRLLCLL